MVNVSHDTDRARYGIYPATSIPVACGREYITDMRKTLLAFHPYLIDLEVLAVLPTSGVLQYTIY